MPEPGGVLIRWCLAWKRNAFFPPLFAVDAAAISEKQRRIPIPLGCLYLLVRVPSRQHQASEAAASQLPAFHRRRRALRRFLSTSFECWVNFGSDDVVEAVLDAFRRGSACDHADHAPVEVVKGHLQRSGKCPSRKMCRVYKINCRFIVKS